MFRIVEEGLKSLTVEDLLTISDLELTGSDCTQDDAMMIMGIRIKGEMR